MTAKLIFSDIDGTLITSGGDVSPDTIDAIRKQIIAGNLFIPVSLERIKDLKGIHKVLVIGKPDTLDKIIPTLQSDFPKLAFVKSAPHLLEIMLKGVNKGKAVKIVLDSFAIDKTNAWAFGDNYNDEPMLKAVGHPILMGNAPEELKNKLNIAVTLDNNHNGIAAALNKISN